MAAADILNILNGGHSEEYVKYSPKDVIITAGIPGQKITGWHYVTAYHNAPQRKLWPNLGGRGVFTPNVNQSGIIEIGIIHGAVSGGALEIIDAAGIPVPIVIADICTGGTSNVLSTSCMRVGNPRWRRSNRLDIVSYQFAATFLSISWGVQLPELDL